MKYFKPIFFAFVVKQVAVSTCSLVYGLLGLTIYGSELNLLLVDVLDLIQKAVTENSELRRLTVKSV